MREENATNLYLDWRKTNEI